MLVRNSDEAPVRMFVELGKTNKPDIVLRFKPADKDNFLDCKLAHMVRMWCSMFEEESKEADAQEEPQ